MFPPPALPAIMQLPSLSKQAEQPFNGYHLLPGILCTDSPQRIGSLLHLVSQHPQMDDQRTCVYGMLGCASPSLDDLLEHSQEEADFRVRTDQFAREISLFSASGAQGILAFGLPGLIDARAAVLAAQRTGLPILVTIRCDLDGQTVDGNDILPCLIALEHLGVAAFGVSLPHYDMEVEALLERLSAHAQLPLAVCFDSLSDDSLSPAQIAERARSLLKAGVQYLGLPCQLPEEQYAAIHATLSQFHLPDPVQKAEESIVLCSDREIFFLEETLELSDPIACQADMADAILLAEESPCDVLCFRLQNADDAYWLSLNYHMLRMPVALQADSPEVLGAGLFFYHGRAIIDSRCLIEDSILGRLAKLYGAIMM